MLQGGVPVLHEFEYAWLALILIDLAEEIQGLSFHLVEGRFKGFEEGFALGRVDGDFDVD